MKHFTKVAGVTFEGRQEILERCRRDMPCRLEPEPTNKYDPNAIKVMVATGPGVVEQVGYVPKNLAAVIAPHLQGESVMVEIEEINGGFETPRGDIASLGMRIVITLPDPETEDDPSVLHNQDDSMGNGGPVYNHKTDRFD